jgi:translation elongation factor EF-Ts
MYQINFWLNTKVPYDLDDQKLLKQIEITNNEENINHYLKKYNVQIPHYTEY